MNSVPEGTAWHTKLPDIPKLGRPLKVALPCVGIDGCTHALQIMETDFQLTNMYDVESGNDALLKQHYREASVQGKVVLNTGTSGDLCSVDMMRLEKPDGLCSGPPCPPWAGNGNKKSQDDPRARPARSCKARQAGTSSAAEPGDKKKKTKKATVVWIASSSSEG